MLRLDDVHVHIGKLHILQGVSLTVNAGECAALLGRNGVGKTTTLRAIMGILGQRTGSVRFRDAELIGLPSNRIARLGIAYCPEERGIFASLDVEENLLLPPVVRSGGMGVDEIYAIFPNLYERRRSQGTKLSGGEQQMLAIGRILRTGASLLLLDEPTEGLAPVIVQQIGDLIRTLKAKGFTVLLVNARHVKNVSGRKSDVLDCQWLQQLMTYGLLSGAFRPADAVCVLRSLWRQRGMLLRSQGRHVQHMQKALTQMNIQLANVLRGRKWQTAPPPFWGPNGVPRGGQSKKAGERV